MLRKPAAALAAVLCTYGLEQWAQSQSSFFVEHTALTNIVTGLIVVLGVSLRALRGTPLVASYPRIGLMVLALFLYAALSVFWSVDLSVSTAQWARAWPYLVALVVLPPLLVTDLEDLRTGFMATLVLGSIIILLLLLTSDWGGRRIILQKTGWWSRTEKGGSPLALASLAGYVSLICLLMNFHGLGRIWQLIRWGVIAASLFVCFQSGSRGQLIALAAAAITFLPLSRRMRSVKGFLATAISLTVLFVAISWAFDQLTHEQTRRWEWDRMVKSYQSNRVQMSLTLLQHWAAGGPLRWLVGLGNSASWSPAILGIYPHVVAVEVLAELGLIGLTMYTGVVAGTLVALRRLARSVRDHPTARGVTSALGALFLFELILTFKQGSMLGNQLLFAFATIIGVMSLSVRQAAPSPEEERFRHLHDESHRFELAR